MNKELIKKLIDHYSTVIELYEDTGDFDVIKENRCESGICFCADKYFDEDIYHADWVTIYNSGKVLFWFLPTQSWETKEFNLTSLTLRLERLKEIYSQKSMLQH